MAEKEAPDGFEYITQKAAPVTANYTKNDDNTYSGSMITDPSAYSTFTAAQGEEGIKNQYNRKLHLPCEFGNPNGAHSEGGKATHLVYLNGGPTADPLEVPMAACAHHQVKIAEKAADLNPDVHPYFRPIANRRMIAEHRAAKDSMNKDLTMTMEAGLLTAGVKEGTPESLWGRSTPNFYRRGKVLTENIALDDAKKRRGNAKLYRIKTGKHAGKTIALDPKDVDSGALEVTLSRAASPEGAGRATPPEGFIQYHKDTSPFRYMFPTKLAGKNPVDLEEAVGPSGTKQLVKHVMDLHRRGMPTPAVMLEAHRLGVHSEVESLFKTHMQPFTTETDEEGTVTIVPGKRPQRSRGTVGVGTRGKVAEKLPADRSEFDLTTGEYRALTPIEAYTENKFEDTLDQSDIEARQAATAEKLRAVEARKQTLANRRKRPGLPGLKNELDEGTGKE